MIKYKAGYKYQLAADYSVWLCVHPKEYAEAGYVALTGDGLLTIKAGYAWDGPSGPTFDTKSAMRGSLVHDALYQLIRLELLPAEKKDAVDMLYVQLCREDGMNWFRAAYHWLGLGIGGKDATRASAEPIVEVAP